MSTYSVIENLLKQVQIPKDGILSRTIHRDDRIKIVVLGFAGGQELSQHTASVPAIIEILQGDARVPSTRKRRSFPRAPGCTWMPDFHMPSTHGPT